MTDRKFIRGHKTLVDGSRVALSEDEAASIIAQVDAADKARADTMPTVVDALRSIISARQRLTELGWRKGGGFFFRKDGEADTRNDQDWAVIEDGSAGIFYANRCDKYFHYQGCVSAHHKVYAKLAADLTPEERAKAEECEESHKQYMEAHTDRMAALSDILQP